MLHVCVSATLYRPIDINGVVEPKSPKSELNTSSTYLGSIKGDKKQYIEHLFMEESKNRLNDYYNTNKLGVYEYKYEMNEAKLYADDTNWIELLSLWCS